MRPFGECHEQARDSGGAEFVVETQPELHGQGNAAVELGAPDRLARIFRQNPYTQRAIERAIKAALAVGMRVVGVQPDGTVLTDGLAADSAPRIASPPLTPGQKPRDAREKLGAGR